MNGKHERYAIDDASADWSAAEAQVARLAEGGGAGKSTLVSVKTAGGAGEAGKKRKAEEAGHGEGKDKGGEKKSRRSMKKGKR